MKAKFEEYVLAEANELLKIEKDEFYSNYLEKTVKDISSVHGGYFSKDNSDKDDKIEKEINEILHDKELLLSLDNPRRFIFSKWTLREDGIILMSFRSVSSVRAVVPHPSFKR